MDDQTRIVLDIAGGVFMHLIGDNMELFADIVNTITRNCDLIVADMGTEGRGSEYDGYNVMVPLGRTYEEVHWIFKDNQNHRHNPYTYKLQKNHSHQFCQSHSLKMAYYYCSGKPLSKSPSLSSSDVRLEAYKELLEFWEILLNRLAKDGKLPEINRVVHDIINLLIRENLENEPEELSDLIRRIGNKFKGMNIYDVLNILKSPNAIKYCPHWN